MTLLRRLSLCLLALALLPGAPVQARLAMAASAAPQAVTAGPAAEARADDCHGAEKAPAPAADTRHGDAAPGASHPADCCGDTADGHGCENACPCPPSITALPPVPQALSAPAHAHRWHSAGHPGRTGPADAPPNRPPIG